jgi:hypothetical protein
MTVEKHALTQQTGRVRRPLGLSLAIILTAIPYGVMPLLEVYFLKRLDATAREAYILGGVDISTWTWVEGVMGGFVLIVCILAWWGHPSQIRFLMVGVLLLLTAINLYRIGEAWTSGVDPISGGLVQTGIRDLLGCQLPAMILAPPYVIWYINRAPARAFYRRVPLAPRARREAPPLPGAGEELPE